MFDSKISSPQEERVYSDVGVIIQHKIHVQIVHRSTGMTICIPYVYNFWVRMLFCVMSSFRVKHSTVAALLDVSYYILWNLDSTGAVF